MDLNMPFHGFKSLSWLLLLSLPASAHHSAAQYRVDQVVAIQGTVSAFDWTNPHTYLFIEDAEGRNWRIEGNATSILRRNGWSRDTLQEQDSVTVRINPARNADQSRGRLLSLTTADNSVYSASTSSIDISSESAGRRPDDIQGIWIGRSAEAFDLLFAYIDHPLTDKGNTARAEYDQSPSRRCRSGGRGV